MSSVLPPSVTQIPPSGGGTPVVTLSVGSTVPPPVRALLVDGALLDVVLVGRPGKMALQVMTSGGAMDLKRPATGLPALADGATLSLKVSLTAQGPMLRLVGVNGRPLPGSLPGSTANAPSPLAAPPSSSAIAPPQSGRPDHGAAIGSSSIGAPGSSASMPLGLTAFVIRSAKSAGLSAPPSLTLPPDLPPGTRLLVRLVDLTSGNAASGPSVPSPSLAANKGMSSMTAGGGTSPAAASGAASPVLPSANASALPILTGSVIAKPPSGQAMVQTEIGTLSLPVDDRVSVGDQVRLEVVDKPVLPPTPPASPARGLGPHGWGALTETLTQIPSESMAKEAGQFLRLLPQMGPNLLTGLTMFVDAVQREERRRDALGTIERALEKRGRRDIAQSLSEDLEHIVQESRQPRGDGDWRLLTLPLVSQQIVEPIRLFIRSHSQAEAESEANTAPPARHEQRFVLDFTLSQMGRLQLDGLVRRDDKQFNLIIRTQTALPEPIRRDITAIFTNASETFGTIGTVGFQAGSAWVDPAPCLQTHTQIMA